MSETVIPLRLTIDTGDAINAADDLDHLSRAAHNIDDSFDRVQQSTRRAGEAIEEGVVKPSGKARDEFGKLIKSSDQAGDNIARTGQKARASASDMRALEQTVGKLAYQFGALVGGVVALDRIKDFFAAARDAAEESAQVWAQVAQGIETTGGVARRSLEDIQKLASGIQNTTLFDDETVAFGAANLLTFTNIAEEAFDRTLKAATDVSQRVGQDFKSTIIQLGKALNDPIANLGALSRTGIQFSETQKEQIANLVQQNKLFEAQSIILTEIEKQYGGSAKAVREAAGGAEAAKNAYGDLLEVIGGPILEQTNAEFENLARLLNDPTTQQSAKLLGEFIAQGMTAALQALQNFINLFNEFTLYLKKQGIIEDIPIEINFDLQGPDINAEQLRDKLLGPDRAFEIGVRLNAAQVEQVQARLEQIEQQRDNLARSKIVNEQGGDFDSAKRLEQDARELERLNTEFTNLREILYANAEATKGVVTGIDKIAEASTEAATGGVKFFNSGLAEQVERLKQLSAAALQGNAAVEALQKEFELQDKLAAIQAAADKAGELFDKNKEERHLRELQRLQEEIEANQKYLDLVQQITGTGAPGVRQGIDKFNARLGGDDAQRGLVSSNPFTRAATINDFDKQLQRLRDELLSIADQLDQETFDQLFADINAAGAAFEKDVKDSAEYLAKRLEEAADGLVESLLEDLIFNGGKNVGDILTNEARQDVFDAIINPLSDFLTGKSDDLFGDILGGIKEVTAKYEKIGAQFDKLFGTESVFAQAFAGAGAGFAGFQFGSGAADILNGRQGETGGKIGGAVGGGIGFAVGGPVGAFIGSAAGGFLGDLFGGLFGRKTGKATLDFLTGEISNVKNSKKDVRNERRDAVIEGAASTIAALAEILDANIKNLALEVKAGKSSIALSIIDPRTGQVVRDAGSVAKDDVQGAIDRVLQVGLDILLEGGDELLKRIAKGLSTANVPAEKLLDSLADIASVLEYTKEPTSAFLDALEKVNDAFKDAKSLAGAFAGQLTDLNTAQLDVLRALADEADKTLDSDLRRIENPLAQDAIDLADEQLLRLREITELNKQLAEVAAAVGGSAVAEEAADAQERLAKLVQLSSAEWEQFITQAATSPEAFKAAADALQYLQEEAADLPVSFEELADILETARISVATAFDKTQQDRLLSFTNPVEAQFNALFESQLKLLESAKLISSGPEDLAARLELVSRGNTEELAQFLESAGASIDTLEDAIVALENSIDKLAESGVDVSILERQVALAQQALIDKTDQGTVDRILRLVSTPASELKALLERQRNDVQVATRIGADVGLVQRANFLELQQFLEALSDDELAGLGDVFNQITDSVGRLPVALIELDKAFDQFVDNRQSEIQRLRSEASRAGDLGDRAEDLRDQALRQFGRLTPLEQFEQTRGDFLEQLGIARDTTQSNDARLDAISTGEDLFSELLQSITKAFGGSTLAATERDRALAALEEFAAISDAIETDSVSLAEALDREYDVLVQIRDKISSSDTDLIPFIQSALATGQISGSPQVIQDLLAEVVSLTTIQDQNRRDLIDAIREASVTGFSSGVSITGTVTINDTSIVAVMSQVLTVLQQIELNQTNGGTLTRLGVAA